MAAAVQAESACRHVDPDDPLTVCGAAVAADQLCLAHLTPGARRTWLAGVGSGSSIDAHGVTFTGDLLAELLDALRDPQGHLRLGAADFSKATFSEEAWFNEATFSEGAWFPDATFSGPAWFAGVAFSETAWFGEAIFSGPAEFRGATFSKTAWFSGAVFSKTAEFRDATFSEETAFLGATFSGAATFAGTGFSGDASFDEVVVQSELRVEALAERVTARRLRGDGRLSLRLRAAEVDLSDVVLAGSVSVHGLDHPIRGQDETAFDASAGVRVVSVRGLDASSVTLTDVDLSQCRFAGLQRTDQIVLDGRCVFADGPGGRRRVLAEEHHWQATRAAQATAWADRWWQQTRGWRRLPELEVVGPARLEVLYRQLRKALEDAKNEPAAGDFYYGEMQMRRAASTRRTERWLLGLYWALSGYGLRARRALAWLVLLIALSITGLSWFGFSQTSKDQIASGTVATSAGRQPIILTIRQSEPVKTLAYRIEKATEVTLNAVIFRNPEADLTSPGRYLNIAVRVLGPILLGLTILAIRNQVKR